MSNGIDRAYASPYIDRYEPPVREDRSAAANASAGTDAETLASASPAAGGKGFFGEDGLTFRDVLDAVNPLNHIPIVSGMLEDATGHKVSTGSKLLGGLMTGPIGFMVSLANVVFEQGTGKGVAETMVAALTDDHPEATQLASADERGKDAVIETAENTYSAAPVETVDAPAVASQTTPAPGALAPVKVAAMDINQQKTLLDLYGGSVPSAHRSYQKAQMRTYLNDVTHSQVL